MDLLIGIFFPWFLIVILYLCHTRLTRTAGMINKFNGGWTVPILGNAWLFLGPSQEIPGRLTRYFEKYGRCVRLWKLHLPWIMIADATVAEKLLSSTEEIDKGRDYDCVRYYMGTGLLTAYVNDWREERRVLNVGFKTQMFEEFLQVFNQQADILVSILEDKFSTGNEYLDIHPEFGRCTLDMACEGPFAKKMQIQTNKDKDRDFLNAMYTLAKSIRFRIVKPWLTIPGIWHVFGMGGVDQKANQMIRKSFREVFHERKAELNKIKDQINGEEKEDFEKSTEKRRVIDILLTSKIWDKKPENRIDQAMNIVGAGSETAATAMNITLFLLSVYPNHQKIVHKELEEIFGDDLKRDATLGDLSKMKHLEMCIKEAMRLYPPVPVITRTLQSDLALGNGLTIPRGSDASVILYDLHRDPKVYPDPEVFRPQRFSHEDSATRSAYAYIPFSIGIRNCIGQRYGMVMMKVVLARILREFQVSTNQRKDEIKLMYGMTIELHPDILLNLRKR